MPKPIAKIFDQNWNIALYAASPVASQRHSSTARKLAMPMLMAGNTIWNDTVNANCSRARWNASKISMALSFLRFAARLTAVARHRPPTPCGRA